MAINSVDVVVSLNRTQPHKTCKTDKSKNQSNPEYLICHIFILLQ